MKNIIKEDRYFTQEHEGNNYRLRFSSEFFRGKYLGDGTNYFTVYVWELRQFKIFGLSIPYHAYICEYLVGSYKSFYSCGSFKYSDEMECFYMNPEDAKWMLPAALENKEYEDRVEAAKEERRKEFKHQSKI